MWFSGIDPMADGLSWQEFVYFWSYPMGVEETVGENRMPLGRLGELLVGWVTCYWAFVGA